MRGKPRVCFGPTEVAGGYGRLVLALREAGVDAVHVNLHGHPFGYSAANNRPLVLRALLRARRSPVLQSQNRAFRRGVEKSLAAVFLAWLIVRFDVFVFGYGWTFFDLRELPLLKLLKKRIIFVFHGSDARPAYLNGAWTRDFDVTDAIARTRAQKERLARIERHADVLVCDPMICHMLTRPIVLGQMIRPPVQIDASLQSRPRRDGQPLRIVHAPSDPVGKGTEEIRRIFSALQSRGHALELIELSGQSNSAVIEQLATCDLVADQLYSDQPMATFATEAAHFRKPVLVGGYAREQYEALLAPGMAGPTVYVDPEQFETAAEELMNDAALRDRLGREAREFVSTHCAPARVAEQFCRLISGDIPSHWMLDPARLRYTHGYGLREDAARERVAAVIRAGGIAALQVSDKPELEQALAEFAAGGSRDEPAGLGSEMSERPIRVRGLEVSSAPEGSIVYDPEHGRVHELNHTAALVLELCNGENTSQDIVRILQAAYDLPTPPEGDTRDCIDRLRREGLVA